MGRAEPGGLGCADVRDGIWTKQEGNTNIVAVKTQRGGQTPASRDLPPNAPPREREPAVVAPEPSAFETSSQKSFHATSTQPENLVSGSPVPYASESRVRSSSSKCRLRDGKGGWGIEADGAGQARQACCHGRNVPIAKRRDGREWNSRPPTHPQMPKIRIAHRLKVLTSVPWNPPLVIVPIGLPPFD